MAETYWNHVKVPCARGTAIVADDPRFPEYWAKRDGWIGKRMPVVFVAGYGYLSDLSDEGWTKVTKGRGGPGWSHRDISIERGSFKAYVG